VQLHCREAKEKKQRNFMNSKDSEHTFDAKANAYSATTVFPADV